MKRVMAVLLIGTLSNLLLGVDDKSWASQAPATSAAGQPLDPVAAALATLRRGATVQIERTNGTRFYAVIEDIAPDTITVLSEQTGRPLTETIPITDIRSIRAVSGRTVAHSHKTLIIAAVVAGVIVVGLLGACAAANGDIRPVPN